MITRRTYINPLSNLRKNFFAASLLRRLSKMNPVLKKNLAVFPALDWIATLTAHIPDKGEQLFRYYEHYSKVSRGKRKKAKPEGQTQIREIDAPPVSKELKKRWSYFIRKVYETDPLVCTKSQGEMRMISFIDRADVRGRNALSSVRKVSPRA